MPSFKISDLAVGHLFVDEKGQLYRHDGNGKTTLISQQSLSVVTVGSGPSGIGIMVSDLNDSAITGSPMTNSTTAPVRSFGEPNPISDLLNEHIKNYIDHELQAHIGKHVVGTQSPSDVLQKIVVTMAGRGEFTSMYVEAIEKHMADNPDVLKNAVDKFIEVSLPSVVLQAVTNLALNAIVNLQNQTMIATGSVVGQSLGKPMWVAVQSAVQQSFQNAVVNSNLTYPMPPNAVNIPWPPKDQF